MIDLFKGSPSPDLLLPASLLREASERVLNDPTRYIPALSYGPDSGYEPLRQAIATWLSEYYASTWTIPERICVSGGASQNLACILQVFTDPVYTRKVYMITPTYFLASRIFEDSGFAEALCGIPEDEEGVDIQVLARNLAADQRQIRNPDRCLKKLRPNQKIYRYVLYAVPTFSNPSGKCMSLRRRHDLIRLARQYDILLITDDVYDFLRWSTTDEGVPAVLPRIVDIDNELDGGPVSEFGNAVSNGSFSKILGPGIRTGWAEATPTFIRGVSGCGSTVSGGAPSQFAASIVSELLVSGSLQQHIQRGVIPKLQQRYKLAMTAIKEFYPPSTADQCWTRAEVHGAGGYFIFLPLPSPLLARDVAARVLEDADIIVNGGKIFGVPGEETGDSTYPEALRLCFAWEQAKELYQGIEQVGRVIYAMLEEEKSPTLTIRLHISQR